VIDVDWFLSILDKTDMAYICQKYKLNVTGFQRNLSKAPIKTLGSTIKTAINNGYQKKKGNKKNHLPFEEMFADIVNDLKEKYPYISEIGFLEYASRAELEPDLREYEIVSIAYKIFPNDFEEHYETAVTNTKQGRYIFYGISEELSKTAKEKINNIVGVNNLHERNIKILKEFSNDCLRSSKDIFNGMLDLVDDEEMAFRAFAKSESDIYLFILVAFLIKNERYKDETYKDLVQTAVLDIQNLEQERLTLNIEEMEEETKKTEKELQELIHEKNRLEEKNSDLIYRLNRHIDKEKTLTLKIGELTTKMTTLENVLQKNEPLQMFFYRVITENNFIIVTKDVEHFNGTPFESVTILPSQFRNEIKTSAYNPYKDQIVYVTRSSFMNGTEWYQFKRFLEKHHVSFEELGQYEITFYIQEIIQHLSRKEVLIYADEI